MKFSTIASLATLASAVTAAPQWSGWNGACISQATATALVDDYIAVLSHTSTSYGNFTQTAEAILADDYQEISDSILSLEGQPVSFSARSLQ